MDGDAQLAILIPMLREVGGAIRPDQLASPTPCADLDVRGVLGHMTGLASMFAPAFRGDAPPAPEDLGDGVDGFDGAMADLLDAVQGDGAMGRTLETPMGAMPGAAFARVVALDGLVHGWDLATATGQEWEPPAEVVAEVDGFARQAISDEMRAGGAFGPAIAAHADADALTDLIAFTGRVVD